MRLRQFAKLYEAQRTRDLTRTAMLEKHIRPLITAYDKVGKAEFEKMRKLLWKKDADRTDPKEVTAKRFLQKVDDKGRKVTNARGNPVYEMNPEHYDQVESWAKAQGFSADGAKAVRATREFYDKGWIMAYDAMNRNPDIDESSINEMRNWMGYVRWYMPHHRYGNYMVRLFDAEGNVIYRKQYFDRAIKLGKARHTVLAKRHVKEALEQYPEAVKWEVDRVKELPEEVYSFPIPVQAIEQVMNRAAERMGDTEDAGKFKREITQAISDVLKVRGWAQHAVARMDVPGHETGDIRRIAMDYASGLSGWLTKLDAATEMSRALAKINARDTPNVYRHASRYMRDMLQNVDATDRIADSVRGLLFIRYLGGTIKGFAVNLTQNITTGIPRLSMETGFAGTKYAGAVWKLTRDVISGKKTLTADEHSMISELYQDATLQDQYIRELKGEMSGTYGNIWNKAVNILGLNMSIAEKFNRVSMALAAYKAARAGQLIRSETLNKLGLVKGQKASHAQAVQFAREMVDDSHFVFGKGNLPQIFRGTRAGKYARPAYTFRSFTWNQLQLWRWMLGRIGDRGGQALLKSMLAYAILGGISSLFLWKSLEHLWTQLFGTSPTEEIRKRLPTTPGAKPNLYRDIVTYGIPAALGVSLQGSMSIDAPILARIDAHQPMLGQSGKMVGEIVGVPWAVLEDFTKAGQAFSAGRWDRAAEELAPVFIRNLLMGYRLHTEGKYTYSGTPITRPGKREATKLTMGEAVAKGMGFQPVSFTKDYEAYRTRSDMEAFIRGRKQKWADKYMQARIKGDQKTMIEIRQEIREWNRKMRMEGKPEYIVKLNDMLKYRMRPKKAPIPFRRREREIGEIYE